MLGLIAVAEERGGQLVAMLGVAIVEHPFADITYAEEQAWYVEPAYRKASLGPRLVKFVLAWAREQGVKFVKMGAPADAPEVGVFYERLAFKPVETAYVLELT